MKYQWALFNEVYEDEFKIDVNQQEREKNEDSDTPDKEMVSEEEYSLPEYLCEVHLIFTIFQAKTKDLNIQDLNKVIKDHYAVQTTSVNIRWILAQMEALWIKYSTSEYIHDIAFVRYMKYYIQLAFAKIDSRQDLRRLELNEDLRNRQYNQLHNMMEYRGAEYLENIEMFLKEIPILDAAGLLKSKRKLYAMFYELAFRIDEAFGYGAMLLNGLRRVIGKWKSHECIEFVFSQESLARYYEETRDYLLKKGQHIQRLICEQTQIVPIMEPDFEKGVEILKKPIFNRENPIPEFVPFSGRREDNDKKNKKNGCFAIMAVRSDSAIRDLYFAFSGWKGDDLPDNLIADIKSKLSALAKQVYWATQNDMMRRYLEMDGIAKHLICDSTRVSCRGDRCINKMNCKGYVLFKADKKRPSAYSCCERKIFGYFEEICAESGEKFELFVKYPPCCKCQPAVDAFHRLLNNAPLNSIYYTNEDDNYSIAKIDMCDNGNRDFTHLDYIRGSGSGHTYRTIFR